MKPPPNGPQGAGHWLAFALDGKVAYLVVSLPLVAVCRHAFFEWLTPFVMTALFGGPLVGALVLLPIEVPRFGLFAFPIVFGVFWAIIVVLSVPVMLLFRLCWRRRFLIQISSAGLIQSYPKRDIAFPWSKFFWVIERKGDLWISSWMDGCFIPREAFTCAEEAREFAAMIRKLKQSGGASWRAEWDGRIFGKVDPKNPSAR